MKKAVGRKHVRSLGGVLVTFTALALSGAAAAQDEKEVRTVIVRPPPPPPAPPPAGPSLAERNAQRERIEAARAEIVDVDVVIETDGQVLWSGPLQVSGFMEASYGVSKREAARPCPGGEPRPYSYDSTQQRLEFKLRRMAREERLDFFSVSTRWERPDEACQGEGGQRTASIATMIEIPAGNSVEIEGDGGLKVRITRR